MEILKKTIFVILMMVLGLTSIAAQDNSEPKEVVIGSVSGIQEAGESYELYERSSDSFKQYLRGWRFVGFKDKMVDYSDAEIREICLSEAKRKYGIDYPNLYLKDFHIGIKNKQLPDEDYHTNVIGSSTEYRKKERCKRIFEYSAIVVVNQ